MALDDLKTEAETMCQFILCSQSEVYGIAPGCVELLGNHADYNEGLVLAATIDRYTVVTGRKTDGSAASVYSDAFERLLQFNTEKIEKDGTAPWLDYIMGVVDQYRKAGHMVTGFEAAICGDVPFGVGISSSASLAIAVACFLNRAFGFSMEPSALALLCRAAETEFVGKSTSLLKHLASVQGRSDSLLCYDCRDESCNAVPFDFEEAVLILADTKVKPELIDAACDGVRSACHQAGEILARHSDENLSHLRDISLADYRQLEPHLPEGLRDIARHIVEEDDRVRRATIALRGGDLAELGRLMLASHDSSRTCLANSSKELDLMVNTAKRLEGCYGARFTGVGYGGATVNLVARDKAEQFCSELSRDYQAATGTAPEMHILKTAAGAWFEKA